jgi:hypothetical protein
MYILSYSMSDHRYMPSPVLESSFSSSIHSPVTHQRLPENTYPEEMDKCRILCWTQRKPQNQLLLWPCTWSQSPEICHRLRSRHIPRNYGHSSAHASRTILNTKSRKWQYLPWELAVLHSHSWAAKEIKQEKEPRAILSGNDYSLWPAISVTLSNTTWIHFKDCTGYITKSMHYAISQNTEGVEIWWWQWK